MKKWLIFTLSILMLLPLFAEPMTYDELVMQLNADNLELKKQDEVIKQAVVDVKNAKGGYHPQITAQLSSTYMTEPPIGRVTVSADDLLGQLGLPTSGTGGYVEVFPGMEQTLYNAQISLTQPIFTWGKISNSVELFDTVLSMRNIEKTDKIALLATQMDGMLAGLYYLNDVSEDLETALEVAKELVELSRSGYENGVMLLTDYRKAELSLKELELKMAEISNGKGELMDSLRKLLNNPTLQEGDFLIEPDEEGILQICNMDRDQLRIKVVAPDRNSMKMLGMMTEVNDLKTDIMKGSLYWKPDFALQVGLNLTSTRFPLIEKGWNNSANHNISISLGMRTTLWDGGVKWNNVKKSESEEAAGYIDIESTKTQLTMMLEEQFRTIDYAMMQIDYLEAKKNLLEAEKADIENKMKLGAVGKADLLQKELEILENKMTTTQQRAKLMQSACTIKYMAALEEPIVRDVPSIAE